MQTASLIRYGLTAPLAEPRMLCAGPLTMLYDRGFLRYIRLGDHEVLRMIYHAVRDHNWATAIGEIQDEVIEQQDDSFRIRYQYVCRNETIHLRWQCEITGDPQGTLQFTINGEALSEFQRNRAGFCVLHPIPECTGQACTLTHPDGSQSVATFPMAISPHQPFFNIREMQWPISNGGAAVLWFVGDVFETEDQRNWTDASYKTYCTPLAKPFPVLLKPGDKIEQSVELRLVGAVSSPLHFQSKPAETVLSFGSSTQPMPAIGIGSNSETLTDSVVDMLKDAGFHHLRVEVNFQKPDWIEVFRKAVDDATQLQLKLEIALIFNQLANFELYTFLKQTIDPALVYSVTVLSNFSKSTPVSLIEQVVPPLRQAFPTALVGAGTNAFFVAVNRETPPLQTVDFVSYAISPQAHAIDNLTMMENTAAQADTVRDARHWTQNVHISPVTLRPRFNPDAKGDDPDSVPHQMPFSTDPRQMALFCAAWTVASLKNLMQAGARSLTYYETVGEQGIVQGDRPSAYPDQFISEAGTLFPVYWVFQILNGFRGGKIISTTSSHPLKVEALLLQNDQSKVLILANQTDEVQTVSVPIHQPVSQWILDEISWPKANVAPASFWDEIEQNRLPDETGHLQLELIPYATAFLEWES
ncbi:hypothetical protein [Larkinella rosea]|uniref:Uncharacterized protein n=1 Tax=Larkinella rosea TaxID=2025312 RepID=A0A3P1BP60_9BACT|nr:hypothetical protein [Larkinella rosea]RRB02284.1 hypothetical protein EHT25_17560 [Larkinella rosea]